MSEIVVMGREELDQLVQAIRKEVRDEVRAALTEAGQAKAPTTGKLYSRDQVAVMLGVSTATVTKALQSGRLRGTKNGGKAWIVTQEALDEYLRGSVN